MTHSVILGCLWVVVASMIAMLPRRFHWPGAAALIALGIPLLGWITWQNGALVGTIALVAGASILRWPVLYLFRWIARRASRGG